MEVVECVFKVSVKIYKAVDEVQANKKRCQRLAERIRCLVTPLNALIGQVFFTIALGVQLSSMRHANIAQACCHLVGVYNSAQVNIYQIV